MNLYLTHKCNRGCPFCFARKVLKQSGDNVNELLSVEEVRTLLNHFPEIENNLKNLGLLGGEPFLYPHLEELLDLLAEREIHAKIFTSATNDLPEVLNKMTIEDAYSKINFIVNVGTHDTYSDIALDNLNNFLTRFGLISSLSYTIFDLNGDATYLFDLIDKYQLVRNIRTGIALPILNGGNKFIPLSDYKRAGDYFVEIAEQASNRGITLSMDCGFIACMFTDSQIGRLLRLGGDVNFMCGAAIDIGPGLKAWNCFPLFQIGRVNVLDADNVEDLKNMLEKSVSNYLGDKCGVLKQCVNCDVMKKHLCEGGCNSFKSLNL